MRVRWQPRDKIETYEGLVLCTESINGHFYFLLEMDDNTFLEARCDECVRLN